MSKFSKKIIPLLVIAAFIFALIPTVISAGNSAHVSISVSPRELAESGSVTVTITITNTNSSSGPSNTTPPSVTNPPSTPTDPPSNPTEPPVEHTDPPAPTEEPGEGGDSAIDAPANFSVLSAPEDTRAGGSYTNIHISNSYGVSFSTQGVSISPGSKKTFTAKMQVSSGMLGVELPFTVSWTDNGNTVTETVTCKVSRLSASPYLSVVRTASPVNASEGTEVTVTYTFTNSGSVKLTNISLVDRYVRGSSSAMLTPFSLEPGATKEYIYTFTMGNKTIVSAPVITFNAQGSSAALVKNVSPLTIGLIQSQLTKEIVKGNPTPEGVQFTIYLTNNGNQKLNDLEVTDDLGHHVSSERFSLAVGESKMFEYFVSNPKEVRYVVFNIEGVDYNNTAFKDNTKSYIVRPYIDTSLFGLTFTAVTASSVSADNVIGIDFSLENKGELDIYNLSITEKELDYEICTWEKLPVGETEKKTVEVNLGDLRDLVFILTSEDSSGNTYTYEAYVTADQIDVGSMIPSHDPSEDSDGIDVINDDSGLGKQLDSLVTSTGEKLMVGFRVLGIIAAVAAAAMLALGIAEIVIRRNKRSRINED